MDATLDRLLEELGEECRTTLNLLEKLRQPLSERDRTEPAFLTNREIAKAETLTP